MNDDNTATGGMDKETFWGAVGCGSWVAFGYLGQLLGLLTTTASKSCVICSLHCVFVAAFAEFVRSRESELPFNVQVLLPAALAVTGVGIVELSGGAGAANIGDLLSFAQPIGFGMGYLQLEGLMSRRPDLAVPVSAIKLGMVALASLLYFEVGPWLQPEIDMDSLVRFPDFGPILQSPMALGGVAYTGLVTTALALWVESIAFARVSATTASLILTTEPIFAAGLGALVLGETFGGSDYLGATLIVSACVLATLMDTNHGEEALSEEPKKETPSRRWPFWGF
jgi:drug/metabolite transporter (DMT)-like permease